MFLNSWSLSLTLCSLLVFFLISLAGRTALRVLRYWDPGSDSNRQIKLESETWLASTLVVYALGFQIVSLVIFLLAADHYCQVIAGAMCATGALSANPFGVPALVVKLAGVFIYGFWIVIHTLDISSENYPLVKPKYIFLLLLFPFLVTDITLQTLYINGLKPDIITSCCAVVFAQGQGDGPNLFGGVSHYSLLWTYYGLILLLFLLATAIIRKKSGGGLLISLYSVCWLIFLPLALVAITTIFSSYIYAMPFHRCPFCILKPEYHYFGFFLYIALLSAAFFGISGGLSAPLRKSADLADKVDRFQLFAVKFSFAFLLIFTILSSYHYLRFLLLGGE